MNENSIFNIVAYTYILHTTTPAKRIISIQSDTIVNPLSFYLYLSSLIDTKQKPVSHSHFECIDSWQKTQIM